MNNEMCGCNGTCVAEEKTSSAKGIVRINYKEDFELVVELLAGDKPYKLGDEDFRIDFIVMASHYTVGRTAGVCERCSVDGNKVRCFMDGHGLPPGELRAEVKVNTPDPNYADGSRLSVAIAEGTVVLVKDNTRFDGAVVKANIPVALVDAYQLAKAHGYKGTIDEYYATFNEIGQLKESIKGTLDEMTKAEKLRATAETERAKAETERQWKQDIFNTAEDERVKNEQQRQNSEGKRRQAELNRFTAENYRESAEVERLNIEQQRNSMEQARQTAEDQRRKNERERFGSENARFKWEEGRTQAETKRQTAEEQRKQSETERANSETARKGNEDARIKAEQQRNATEEQRSEAERQRVQQETSRQQAENTRVKDELLRTDSETKRQQAERERVQAENVRTENEKGRLADEQQRTEAEKLRADAEEKRASAEQLRADAETKRIETDKEIMSTLEYVNAQKYIKENEYERDVRAIETIKNAPKDPTQDVWLDATDGEIKSGPATENLTKNAITYYYLGKRVIKGNFSGSTKESAWSGNAYIRHLDVRNWDMTLCTDASIKFNGYSNLVSLDTSNWNLSALTNGYYMFNGCNSLQTLDTSNWNLSALTNGSSMFRDCNSLQTLDTSNWNLSALTNGQQMFSGCGSLQTLDTSNWNLAALTNGQQMFSGCNSLQTLDFRKSTFRNVTNLYAAFDGCYLLAELWLPLTFDKLTVLDLTIPSWGSTPQGLASLRWTFGEGADDRTAKGFRPCTVILNANVYDRLTDNERAAAAKKGWTITK